MLTVLVSWVVVSCVNPGPAPVMGDIEAGPEPLEGGIKEVPNPDAAMAGKSGKPLEQLKRGYVTYMLRCGECHRYELPQNLDIDEWEDAMPKMIKHAGLAADDERAVLDYVVAVISQHDV